MKERQPGGPFYVFANATYTWLVLFVAALFLAAVVNGLFSVPLEQVVDVVFAIQLLFVAVVVLNLGILFVEEIVTGRFTHAFASLCAAALALLFPFAAIAGYRLYASLVGADITKAINVYFQFIHTFTGFLFDASVLHEGRTPEGLIALDVLDKTELVLIAISIVASVLATASFRRRSDRA